MAMRPKILFGSQFGQLGDCDDCFHEAIEPESCQARDFHRGNAAAELFQLNTLRE